MTQPTPAVATQQPKDVFIADWKKQIISKRAAFADALIERLFGSGFGVLGKKELELCIVALLDEAGAFATHTDNALSMAMGITEARVSNLLYAARLRYGINDEDYLRRHLPELLTKMSPKIINVKGIESVSFTIADGVLHQVLNDRVEQVGGSPDTSFNPDIFVCDLETFKKVVFRLIPDDLKHKLKEELGDNWQSKVGKAIMVTIKVASGAAVKGAAAKIAVPMLATVWNFAQPHVGWVGNLIGTMGKLL